jgi:hypothetical protein
VRKLLVVIAACANTPPPFPLRAPLVVDTDRRPVSVACHPDAASGAITCAPRKYISPFLWDHIDKLTFDRLSRALAVEVSGEAANANSVDEVADSSWFTNRRGAVAHGACSPDDLLPPPDQVADGAWTIDHGKDDGSTLGFRIAVPGKGQYLLKADDNEQPERASAASVISAAIYHELGFNTTCEQVIALRPAQLRLAPNLITIDNSGARHPLDAAAVRRILASTTQLGDGVVRMQASKWLPGITLGPFRYTGVRDDDPNDIIDHADRRELRASRLLAAWIDHWDAREQNSMDVWMASDAARPRSSPGYVVHYLFDMSDAFGEPSRLAAMTPRLGHVYELDLGELVRAFVTLGIEERPWDRARLVPGREKFGMFRATDFTPARWVPAYPNPAFVRMTERDGAWIARKIARFSADDIRRIVTLGRFRDRGDADYLAGVLVARQRAILARYFARLSPLGDVREDAIDRICVTDFARLRSLAPAFRYTIVERSGETSLALAADVGTDGAVCFRPRSIVAGQLADADRARIVTFEVGNGTCAGPLVIHAYDLGARGMRVVGATRPER